MFHHQAAAATRGGERGARLGGAAEAVPDQRAEEGAWKQRDRPRRPAELDVIRRLVTAGFWIAIGLCAVLLASKAAQRFEIRTLWDDAYMFQRYAHNLVAFHRIAWNPHGPPTYGLTSLSFLLISAPLYLLTGGNVSLAAMLQSFLCGLALLPLLGVLVLRGAGTSRGARRACFLLVAFCLAVSSFPDHLVSGMDTAYGLCFAATYLLSATHLDRSPSLRGAVVLGALGGLALSIRPELTVFSIVVPLAMATLDARPALKHAAAVALAVTALVLACHLALAARYFGTPLPLPFYAKSTNLYGKGILRAYRGNSTVDLVTWLGSYWPLFAVVSLDVLAGVRPAVGAERGPATGVRAWWRATSALEKGALVGSLSCIGYAWLFVVPIMGYSQRFYYAPLPALIYVACRSTARLLQALDDALRTPAPVALQAGALAVIAYVGSALSPALVTAGKDLTGAVASDALGRFDAVQHAGSAGPTSYWFALDKFSALPDDVVIASTEVGLLGAVNLGKEIIDLAGLNDRDYALDRFSADRFFAAHKPDVIYMPHPHYAEMIAALNAHPEMAKYDVYTNKQVGTSQFGVAIRRDSPHYAEMQAIVYSKAPRVFRRE